MTSYPSPSRKGTYISLFWSIFNMGGVIGGLVLNYHRTSIASFNDATYLAFMAFMSVGTLLSLSVAILSPSEVIPDDGTRATAVTYSNVVLTEFVEILRLFGNWKMLLIAPAAWASKFFYSHQFNNVNGLLFNVRTKGLNEFYWGAQMVGSMGIGYLLDSALGVGG